jgi:rod shape-determining protein MreC
MGNNKKINYGLILLVIAFVVILIFSSSKNKPLESTGRFLVKPLASFFSESGFWFKSKLDSISSIGKIKKERDYLMEENLNLKFKVSQLKEVEKENQVLREELDLKEKNDFKTEASLIIGRNLSNNRKLIYLDKGEREGIKKDSPVIIGGGILIGKISKVYSNSSEVELILDKNNKINAEIQEIEIKGMVQGEYGTSAFMDMIPQTAKIEKGQTVITSGLGGTLPRGLLIGHVKDFSETVDKLFLRASLELPVQFNDLRMVWIIKE